MAARIVVFQNEKERAMMCADFRHDWNQKRIFGKETEKLLSLCDKLFNASLRFEREMEKKELLNKVYGIAKSHGVSIKWYGNSCPCEPDRFLVSGHGIELAIIQC